MLPLDRVERFEAGEIGGREYFERRLRFTFEAREAVESLLGPLEVALDGEALPVRPAWLSVRELLPGLFPEDEAAHPEPVPDAGRWFASPGTLSEVSHPFARWERGAGGAGGAWDLVVGVDLDTNGEAIPADLVLAPLDARCGPWVHPRRTAFLRRKAEGRSRVWFHHQLAAGSSCPDGVRVEVTLGDVGLFAEDVAAPGP